MNRPLFVSLGDSIASGEGVGLRIPPAQTWPRLVAASADARFVGLARGGTPIAGALREQVPLALRLRPDVAFLCVGLNDLFRSGGDPDAVEANLRRLVNTVYASGTTVVAAKLHDPTRMIVFPDRAARVVGRHVAAVNCALEGLAAQRRVELVDLGSLDSPGSWSVDRLHPSVHGHRVLAAHAAERLGMPGPIAPGTSAAVPTSAQFWQWLMTHGSRWALRRLPELAGSAPLRINSRAAMSRVGADRPDRPNGRTECNRSADSHV